MNKTELVEVMKKAPINKEVCNALIAANKAVQRVSVQFERVYLLREGVSRRTDLFLPEEEATLSRLINYAIGKLVKLNRLTRILDRKYDFTDENVKLELCLDMACLFDDAIYELSNL